MVVDPAVEAEQIERLKAWRAGARRQGRRGGARRAASAPPRKAATSWSRRSRCAKAGVTTGEWGATLLREVFGEYRAPTGVAQAAARARRRRARRGARARRRASRPSSAGASSSWSASRASTATPTAPSRSPCAPATVGMEVVYEGIRLTPAQIVRAALDEGVHVVGLSILSGSHVPLVDDVMERMREEGLGDVPVVVGGIIPPEDAKTLKAVGVAARLHAEGLRAQRHHGRHRAAGRRPGHGGVTARGIGGAMREETRRKLERALWRERAQEGRHCRGGARCHRGLLPL